MVRSLAEAVSAGRERWCDEHKCNVLVPMQAAGQLTTLPFSVATASSVNEGGLLEFQHASDEDALDAVKEKALKLMGVQLRIVRWRLLEECDMLRVNIMAAQSSCCLRF